MRVHIVCYEEGWILWKMARRLADQLAGMDVPVSIAQHADPDAEVNHHVIYHDYPGRSARVETLMVTHIDTEEKVQRLRRGLDNADMAICMSRDTLGKLEILGFPRQKLCFVSPGHDAPA